MRAFARAIVLATICGSPAVAADDQASWEGFLTVTSSTGCSGVGGASVGETLISIFRPHIASADVPAGTTLFILFNRASMSLANASESTAKFMNGSGNHTVNAVNSRGKPFSYTAPYKTIKTVPTAITTTTSTINVTGTFNNYWNTSGCTVGFKAIYVKRID